MSKGYSYWERAKKVIPGGNMLLSKRAELFLPGKWPSYFSSARGCNVTDLDGNSYIDMTIMGIGTNTLGYGCKEVDEAVIEIAKLGNLSTLNCFEEVLLAEKLVSLHPWADMARFCRAGGEANSIAVRIARAFKNKEKIALCGYHGWHDWYLASNIENKSALTEHLLSGLSTNGIPKDLSGTVLPFSYNNIQQIYKIIKNNDLAAVIMEVERSTPPSKGYLEEIRDLCNRNNIVLIFDEISSGFRETLGGLHLKYSVEPDMCIFGKALGNGYAITAILGKEEIMQTAQETFISSTFWTERIGPTAALKTLEIMERTESYKKITKLGLYLKQTWQKLADKYNLKIIQKGIPALSGFNFNSSNDLAYKTLITQEMLKKGYLASNICYLSTAHSYSIIDEYANHLQYIFELIAECENGRDVKDFLDGSICHSGFQRLN